MFNGYISGCPLLTLEGNRSQIRPHHTQLYIQNPVIKYELGYDVRCFYNP